MWRVYFPTSFPLAVASKSRGFYCGTNSTLNDDVAALCDFAKIRIQKHYGVART